MSSRQHSPPQKRKRTGENDSDSDDGFGPSAAPQTKRSIGPSLPTVASSENHTTSTSTPIAKGPAPQPRRPIGPALPPSMPENDDEIALDDSSDSEDGAGPAPPPGTSATAASPPSKRPRVLGPAPPPAPFSERPPTGPDSDNDSDSDDDWGPSLPSGDLPSQSSAPASAARNGREIQEEPSAPKRDDWMVAPPTSKGYSAPDPTKLKNRKFVTGPRAGNSSGGGGVSSMWTETPEEKRRRVANAVLGRADPSSAQQIGPSLPSNVSSSSGTPRTAEDEARIRAYTEQTRGKSLVEQHQEVLATGKKQKGGASRPQDEEDDPSKRAFDWEKDMKVGGRISNTQRRDLVNKASNFGGRFQSGSYL